MSEPEKFLDRWSRRKREAADVPAQICQRRLPATAEPKDIAKAPPPDAETKAAAAEVPFDPASLPPIELITARIRHPRVPQTRCSAGTRACGASSRLVGGSGNSRLHRPDRESVGLQRSAWRARLRPDAGGREHRPACLHRRSARRRRSNHAAPQQLALGQGNSEQNSPAAVISEPPQTLPHDQPAAIQDLRRRKKILCSATKAMLQCKMIQPIGKASHRRVGVGTAVRSRNNDRAYSFWLLTLQFHAGILF